MPSSSRQEIILSLDFLSNAYALEVAKLAKGKVWGFRINEFVFHYGSSAIYELKNYGRVFADIKLYDSIKNSRAIIRTMQAAGADLVSAHYTTKLDTSNFDIEVVGVGGSYDYSFIDEDTIDDRFKIIHAHKFTLEDLAVILDSGAADDNKSVGKKEV